MSNIASLLVVNATQDVAEVQLITIDVAVEGEKYGATFDEGGGAVPTTYTAGAENTTAIATGLEGAITASPARVTAVDSTNTVELTADRTGVPIIVSVFGPSTSVAVVTPAESQVAVALPPKFNTTVAGGGSAALLLNMERLSDADLRELDALSQAGKVSFYPPIASLRSGVHTGALSVPAGETVSLTDMRITGDVVISATGTLLATDCFFEADLDNSAGGTCTLSGGRVIGAKSGSITHDAGDVGV